MPHRERSGDLRCNFCGRYENDGRSMVAGPGIYICDECVALAVEVLEERKESESPETR